MSDLELRRRFFAEEIEAVANVRSTHLVDALARVPRERFLPPGPWRVRGEGDVQARPRLTPDANPARVYHNVAVAIDAERQLFNGAPGVLATALDALELSPGARVLHVGAGLGYYTAVVAQAIGSTGRVLGVEVDAALAAAARANLTDWTWADVRHGNGTEALDASFDAILVNAGVTHPLTTWLDALAPDGRLVVPLTATMPAMTPIGKGLLVCARAPKAGVLVDRARWEARVLTFVAIYSAVGVREDDANRQLGRALRQNPFPPLKSLRRDSHDAGATCWMHTPGACWSGEDPTPRSG